LQIRQYHTLRVSWFKFVMGETAKVLYNEDDCYT